MRVAMDTDSAHAERGNEDFVAATAHAAVLVDGAGIPGTEELCQHGVAWYARTLGTALLAELSHDGSPDIRDALAASIATVTDRHRTTCDVTHVSSPQATVAAVRVAGDRLDHLVLADATVVLVAPDGTPDVLTDPREVDLRRTVEEAVTGLTRGTPAWDAAVQVLRDRRNQPGGYWIAKDDPAVAAEAVVGSIPLAHLRGVALLSNGATRLVDSYGVLTWPQLIRGLADHGPDDLLRLLRATEAQRVGEGEGTAPDDASILWWTWAD